MQNEPDADKQKQIDEYYEQLRKGSRNYDDKTASALLMQVAMEDHERMRQLDNDRRSLNVVTALMFPWRLFDPRVKLSNALRIGVIGAYMFALLLLPTIITWIIRIAKH